MKIFTKTILGVALASSTLFAQNNLQLELGAANVSLGNTSESGTTIKLKNGKDAGFNLELGYTQTENLAITTFGGNYNWQLSPKFYTGLNLSATGVSGPDSYNSSSFQGVVYGINAKYKFAPNHGIALVYNTGSVTDKTGYVDFDIDTTSLVYSYNFDIK
jgi:hypothetical protein